MDYVKQQYNNLDTLIDGVHALFAQWEAHGAPSPVLASDTLHLMKLSVHEWLANLVQHANFGARTPEVSIDIWPNGESVRCVIEDNSEGFDLQSHLDIREALLDACPERGMGYGPAHAQSLYGKPLIPPYRQRPVLFRV